MAAGYWGEEEQIEVSGEEDDDYNFDHEYPAEGMASTVSVQVQQPTTAMRNVPGSRMGMGSRKGAAPGSSMGQGGSSAARPMTSISSANYSSTHPASGRETGSSGGLKIVKRLETSPEMEARQWEKKVHALIEESAVALAKGEPRVGLEKAKEAFKKEKQLVKFREASGLMDGLNMDLTYATYCNLANQYHKNGMFTDALTTYNMIVKSKQYAQGGRMRVNMGNIFYEQKKYKEAVKMYRMAMDQIPNTAKDMRYKIMRNIGNSFIAQGKFQDAIQAFETIMEACPDYRTGLNLLLCYYSLGNKDKMKSAYSALISIRKSKKDPTHSEAPRDDEEEESDDAPNDVLRQELRERQKLAERIIIMCSKLIAPAIEKDFATGFDYVVETLRATKNSDLANELEISKALTFMKKKDVNKAIETLKSFEKKDHSMAGAAATNLSFLYFLEKDLKNAERYANMAIKSDKYNAKALVNKGNCYFEKGKLETAKELYGEALSAESDCIEALYNLGLVNKRLGMYDKAMQYFNKLNQVLPSHGEVLFQIAALQEDLGNYKEAEDKYKALLTLITSDPVVLQRLGSLAAKMDDDIHAHQYYMESWRYFPADLNVISWLGAYYVKSEMYEKAVDFFKRASQLEPKENRWLLMIASCYRRMRAYRQAKDIYELIHQKDTSNAECLRYLVQICNDLGLKDQVDEYVQKLSRIDKEGNTSSDTADSLMSQMGNSRIRTAKSPKASLIPGAFAMARSNNSSPNPLSRSGETGAWGGKEAIRNIAQSFNQSINQTRPGTAGMKKKVNTAMDEDFGEDELPDEMLPF